MEGAAPDAAERDAAAEAEDTPEAAEAGAGGEGPAQAAGESAGGAGAEAAPAESAAAGSEGAAAAEAAVADDGGDTGAPAPAAEPAGAAVSEAAKTEADPDATQRKDDVTQARDERADTQRVAESGSEEHAEEQAEQQADSGGPVAGGTQSAELSSGERDAGLASLSESAGGGGDGGGAGGGGGGGGGTPVPEPQPAPDTASGDPESGLAAAATLQPAQTVEALDGVGTSIDNTAKQEGESLQDQVPEVEVGGDGGESAVVQATDSGNAEAPSAPEAEASQPTPEPEPLPAAGPSPVTSIPSPQVADTAEGTVSAESAASAQRAVSSVPTSDPGLDVSAGPAPTVELSGDASPALVTDQKASLDQTVAQQQARGAAAVAQPAGENNIRVTTPKEMVKGAKIADPAAGAGGVGEAPEEAVAVVAEEKKGGDVRSAMAAARGEMAGKRAEHNTKVAEERTKNDQEIARLKDENVAEQSAERAGAKSEVSKARQDWSAEQRSEVDQANEKSGREVAKGNEQITKEESQANEQAGKEIEAGEKDAAGHKADAESKAAQKKKEAESESSGFFSWIGSKVSSFFDALKSAVGAIFDAATKLVRAAIDKAKKLAVAIIETARKAIVAAIRAVGAALIAIGDVLLAAFPSLRAKWRSFIEDRVRAAEKKVNELADKLKKGVTRLLDLLGKAFEFLLNLYKKALLAVLNAAKAVAMGAINFAKNVAAMIGAFIGIIKDVASNPGQWISNLGSAVMDGIKNHLWKAFASAVKEWFNSKLEEVLGVGTTIWGVLKQGGITLKEVGQMAFEALKAAIPPALIQLLIEKLVAMIVPAAGAVMVIIEGLQAAWGTVQRLIAALGKFVAFLKAVKGGGAGPQFASLLAAAAIVVIDFVANWLLRKLRGPASKVGSKVKAIAQKIMGKIKGALKKVGGAVKKVAKKIGGALKKGKKKFGDWRARRKAKKDAKKSKDGKTDPGKKKQDKEAEKRERLRKAVEALRPKLESLASKGRVSGLLLKARLLAWRVYYRLSALQMKKGGSGVVIEAAVNPKDIVRSFVRKNDAQLRKMIYDVAEQIFAREDVQNELAELRKRKAAAAGAREERTQREAQDPDARKPKKAPDEEVVKVAPGGTGTVADSAARRDPLGKNQSETVDIGGGRATQRQGAQLPDRTSTQQIIAGGAYEKHWQLFAQVARSSGVSSSEVMAALVLMRKGQPLPPSLDHAKDVMARQAALMNLEAARSKQALVIGPDLANEVAQGRMTVGEAFSPKENPMAAKNAVRTASEVDKQLGHQMDQKEPFREDEKPTKAEVRRMINAQIRYLVRVIKQEAAAEQIVFTDEAAVKAWVNEKLERKIKERTLANLGLE